LNPGQPGAVLTGVGGIGTLKGLEREEEADAGRGCSRLPAGKAGHRRAPCGCCDRPSRDVRSLVPDGKNQAATLGVAARVHVGTSHWLTGRSRVGRGRRAHSALPQGNGRAHDISGLCRNTLNMR
jgi:hypothetical protein